MGATRGSLTLALLCAAALSGARGETRDDACTRCGCRAGPYTPPCAGVGLRFPRLCGRADCRACAAQGLRCRRHLRRRRLGVHAHGAWRSAHAARHPLAAARAAPEPCGLCFPRAGLAAARRRRAARRARDAHRPGRRLHRLPARFRRAGNRVQRRCVCQRGACPPPHRSRHAPRRHSDAAPPLRWTWRACWRAKLRGSRRGCPGFWTAFAPREKGLGALWSVVLTLSPPAPSAEGAAVCRLRLRGRRVRCACARLRCAAAAPALLLRRCAPLCVGSASGRRRLAGPDHA
jgi:hypothetical protein